VLGNLVLPEDRSLRYAEARRNVITRGIALNALVGRTQPRSLVRQSGGPASYRGR
jgi:hypothetical protein